MMGHRVVNLNGKCPDAIEAYIKDGKIVFNIIEVMSGDTKKHPGRQRYYINQKKSLYTDLGFDDVQVYEFYRFQSPALERKRNEQESFGFESISRF